MILQLNGGKEAIGAHFVAIAPNDVHGVHWIGAIHLTRHDNGAIVFEEAVMVAIDGVNNRPDGGGRGGRFLADRRAGGDAQGI